MGEIRTSATGDQIASSTVEKNLFRDVIGRFASGVTIITTIAGSRDFGTTASAVSSLSMDPPMLLICMNRTSETGQAIAESGRFAVNILGEGQADVATRFATKDPDKFSGLDIDRGVAGVPLVADALGYIECEVAETATGGTHWVFLSNVVRASATEGSPLTYFRGRFGRFEESAQEEAYHQIRRLVMGRAVGAGETLSIDDLATELELERPRVQYALMKLTTDGLVDRDPERGYVVRPLDAAAAHDAIYARSAIEIAVADDVVGTLSAEAIAGLREQAAEASRAVATDPPDYELLRASGREFHRQFIALSGSETLVDMYRRLRIDAIWGRLLRGRHLSPDYLNDITDACEAGDTAAVKRAIRDHAQHATRVVEEMIAEAGGSI